MTKPLYAWSFGHGTGRHAPPSGVASEAWLVIGRRGGKSFALALIATYLAAFFDDRRHLAPGEHGVVLVLAASQKQARLGASTSTRPGSTISFLTGAFRSGP